jgi:uncharacterized membrane protein
MLSLFAFGAAGALGVRQLVPSARAAGADSADSEAAEADAPPGAGLVSAEDITPVLEEQLDATVTDILEQRAAEDVAGGGVYQRLRLLVTGGSRKGERLEVESGQFDLSDVPAYEVGDRVVVLATSGPGSEVSYYVTDFNRRASLYWMLAVFVAVTVIVGGRRGAASLVGMALSFAVLFAFIVPWVASGGNPLLAALAGSALIVPPAFVLSHGWNRKTLVAALGTVITLGVTGVLVTVYVSWARLTGHASEDFSLLQAMSGGLYDTRGILLSGITIALIGIFDDVTVAQASVVLELRRADPSLGARELYRRAMRVGRDHIASMVNTLILVYAGASLPTLLLFRSTTLTFNQVLNMEAVAEEVVRSLVGSTGLILAVPLTTLLAAAVFAKKRFDGGAGELDN